MSKSKNDNTSIHHPGCLLTKELIAVIRRRSAASESVGYLHPEILQLAYDQNWFKLLAPTVYSGLETDLPTVVRMEEALSWADGSLGWVVTLCSGAGWFGGFLNPAIARKIFDDPKACIAGSGAASGSAMETNNGFKIHGTWKYATGSLHATYFTANCQLFDKNGQQKLNADGSAAIGSFIFKKEEVQIIDGWDPMGMIATGSHSFTINGLETGFDRCFEIDRAAITGSLYQYPFLQLAEVTLAGNFSGMAIHFLEECKKIFDYSLSPAHNTKAHREELQNLHEKCKNRLNEARALFFDVLDHSWKMLVEQNGILPETREKISTSSKLLAKTARKCIDQLYPFCGLKSAFKTTEINRVWRDFHTAGQHSLLR